MPNKKKTINTAANQNTNRRRRVSQSQSESHLSTERPSRFSPPPNIIAQPIGQSSMTRFC